MRLHLLGACTALLIAGAATESMAQDTERRRGSGLRERIEQERERRGDRTERGSAREEFRRGELRRGELRRGDGEKGPRRGERFEGRDDDARGSSRRPRMFRFFDRKMLMEMMRRMHERRGDRERGEEGRRGPPRSRFGDRDERGDRGDGESRGRGERRGGGLRGRSGSGGPPAGADRTTVVV